MLYKIYKMKKNYIKPLLVLLFGFIFNPFNIYSQTEQQTKDYHNKTNIAIYKCQKQLLQSTTNSFDIEFKEILKLQLESENYFKATNLQLCLGFSNECKTKCLQLLTKLKVENTTFFQYTTEEITLIKNTAIPNPLPDLKLTSTQLESISTIDVKNPQATYTLIKNVN